MIPSWLTRYATPDDLREIESAVAHAESHTAGEIVPMIVRASTVSGHVAIFATILWFLVLSMILSVTPAHWVQPYWAFELGVAFVSIALGWFRSQSPGVRRLFTSAQDQAASVSNRAQLEFYQTGIPSTEGRTGVLIFVSLQERRAVVLGDEAISKRLQPETWVSIIEDLLKHMRARRLREGYVEAIGKVGEILAREFPIQPGDTNELPNALVVKD